MGDDHASGLAVRRHEHLHAPLEFGVGEYLRWQVEGVVVFGGVEGLPHGGGVLQRSGGLVVDPRRGGVVGQGQVPIGLLGSDLGRQQRQQFRLERIQFVQTGRDPSKLVGQRVDTVECVEDGSQRRTDRNVEAVRLPVEVVAQRPEEVVEIGDLVAQGGDRGDGCVKRLGLFGGRGGGLLLQGILLLQNADRFTDLIGLLQQVSAPVVLIFQVLDLAGALRADLKRYRAVVQRGSQRPGDGLHLSNTLGVEDRLGHPLHDDHVGWSFADRDRPRSSAIRD